MATSENSCIDNYSLPQGPAGPQGIQGNTGPIGLTGPQGQQGVQGAQGEHKIDINIQEGNNPYTDIITTAEEDTAFFIFPGTTTFSVTSLKVITSAIAFNATVSLTIKLYEVASSGTTTLAGTVITTTPSSTATTHQFGINTISSLTMPANEAMMKLTVQMTTGTPTAGSQEARVYALELK